MATSKDNSSYEPNFILVRQLPVLASSADPKQESAPNDEGLVKRFIKNIKKILEKVAEPFENCVSGPAEEPESADAVPSVEEIFTEEILAGDLTYLKSVVNRYNRNFRNIENSASAKQAAEEALESLKRLFGGNSKLAQWIIQEPNRHWLRQLPIRIRELINEQLRK